MVQEAEELLSLSWGYPSPNPPPVPPSLRGPYVLHPHPHPRSSSFLSPPGFLLASQSHPLLRLRIGASEESICSLYSGLDPPRRGPKGPGSRSPEEGPCFLTALGGCRQTSFLCAPPASEPAAHSALRTRFPALISSWYTSWAPHPSSGPPSPGTSAQGRASQ